MPIESRAALLDLLATHSFKLGDFVLASGARSDYYIDCRITTLHAEGGRLSGMVLYDLIREHVPAAEAVGGLTMGRRSFGLERRQRQRLGQGRLRRDHRAVECA